jgi:hypothetical protein
VTRVRLSSLVEWWTKGPFRRSHAPGGPAFILCRRVVPPGSLTRHNPRGTRRRVWTIRSAWLSVGVKAPGRHPDRRAAVDPAHLIPPTPRHRAITAANLAGFSLRDDRLFVEVEADTPGAWILTSRTVNRAAQVADAES